MLQPLLYLIYLDFCGQWRRFFHQLTSPRHAAPAVVLLLIVPVTLVAPFFLHLFPGFSTLNISVDMVRGILSTLFLLLWLSNLLSSQGARVLMFNLAEIDFLFPGPFTQRHLLIYKIVKGIVAPSAI